MERHYLEKTAGKTTRFCELELDASTGRIRIYTGKVGTIGSSDWDDYATEEAAREELARRIERLRAEGYVERTPIPPLPLGTPEPERLPGAPLTEEQLARFTRALVEHPTEVQRQFWEREMARLLREKVYTAAGRLPHIGHPRSLAQELEAVAAMESPAMRREVERNDRGMVVELRYYIADLLVLTLRNRHTGLLGYPPIRPFFCLARETDGFTYGRKKTLVGEMRALLTHFPAFCAEYIARVEGQANERVKEQKIASVATVSIDAVVDALMAGTGRQYRLNPQPKGTALQVLISPTRYVELNMPHKTFLDRRDDILPIVDQLADLTRALPVGFTLGPGSADYQWGTVYGFELNYNGNDPRAAFWLEPFLAYRDSIFRPDPEDGPWTSRLDVETIAQWDIAGLEAGMKPRLEYSGGRPAFIWYAIDGRDLLALYPSGYSFSLINVNMPVDELPPLPQWRRFLEGFPAFYRQHEAAFDQQYPDARWARETRVLMERLGYQWHLDLSVSTRVHLAVLMPKKRVLVLSPEAEQFDALLPQLPDVLGRVEQTIRGIKHVVSVRDVPAAQSKSWKQG